MGRPARIRPTRTCVACRTAREKRELVRIVRAPTGTVGLDPSGRRAGRGAYLCADGACWQVALRRGSISRALGRPLGHELAALLAAGPGPDLNPTSPSSQGGARGT